MDWKEQYKQKLVSLDEAVGFVKSGDRVVIGYLPEPTLLVYSLAARKDELRDVTLELWTMQEDCGWYDTEGWDESFHLDLHYVSRLSRPRMDAKRADYTPVGFFGEYKNYWDKRPEMKPIDIMMLPVSPPDNHGYVSMGSGIWSKQRIVQEHIAKKVIAEVDERMIRTYGNNLLHVSDIDCFVESNISDPIQPAFQIDMSPQQKVVGEYIATLVHDGDTIQTGVGSIVGSLFPFGVFDQKHDLGIHTEYTTVGIDDGVRKGIITGRRKNFHPNKILATGIWPTESALELFRENPMFEMYDVTYTNNPKVIAANDNLVAINQGLMIDLSGQVVIHTIGNRIYSGMGGQVEFVIGALMSKGGRSITVIESTGKRGTVSNIVPRLPENCFVGIPNIYIDYVISEYGIARLRGKTLRERAQELISIAHPDFRSELMKASQKLLYA